LGWDWGPIPGQQFVDAIDRMIGDASDDVGEPHLGIDVIEASGLDERVHDGGSAAGEEIVLAPQGHRPFILPVLGPRLRSMVEGHYRWHALYGRRMRLHYSEVRAGTPLSFVEAGPGVVIVMPSWMLDPAACADATLGAPRVDCATLKDLSRLLIDRGFRRSSPGEVRVAEEEPNEVPARDDRSKAETRHPTPARYRVRGTAAVDDAAV
jgi:hypothetical protein